MAEQQASQRDDDRRRALELERQQSEYEVQLARRRYEAVDPANRLVAAELEARWNAALTRLRDCEVRLGAARGEPAAMPDRARLMSLAADLEVAWNSASTAMNAKQRLLRTLVQEIVVDLDDEAREIIFVLHWRGGQHSELRIKKPSSGEHTKRAPAAADTVIRDMATKWSDDHIAATLNRMGLKSGQGLSWSAKRVASHRRTHGIAAYEARTKDGHCLTMSEAAAQLGVSHYMIRTLIKAGLLPARQVVKDAPWQILIEDLRRPEVLAALRARSKPGRPCRDPADEHTLRIPGL